jgi:ATP adenylyltransferase
MNLLKVFVTGMFDMSCPFCDMPSERIIRKNKHFYLVEDGFPVTKHHTLVISHSHELLLDTMNEDQTLELAKILKAIKKQILKLDRTITGFNIGINEGLDAGQTVMHFHCHVIPRRNGDAHNPRGGVRGVISDKQGY